MIGFVGVREISNNTKKTFYRLRKDGALIVTEHGKPIAVMVPIKDENYGFDTAYEFVKEYEAQLALMGITKTGQSNSNPNMTMEEIDAEIAKARKERHEKEKRNKK